MKLSMRRSVLAGVAVLAAGGVAIGTTAAYASDATTPHTASTSTHAKHQHARRDHLRLGAMLLRFSHGQRTVKDRSGAWVTHETQVGVVTSDADGTLVVRSADGTTWSWHLDSTTTVRADGAKQPLSYLKTGAEVIVTGQLNGGSNDARHIIAPTAAQIATWEQQAQQWAAHRHAHRAKAGSKAPTSPSSTGNGARS
jgi:hypothetical protein